MDLPQNMVQNFTPQILTLCLPRECIGDEGCGKRLGDNEELYISGFPNKYSLFNCLKAIFETILYEQISSKFVNIASGKQTSLPKFRRLWCGYAYLSGTFMLPDKF